MVLTHPPPPPKAKQSKASKDLTAAQMKKAWEEANVYDLWNYVPKIAVICFTSAVHLLLDN